MIVLLQCAVNDDVIKMIEGLLGEEVSLLFYYEDALETMAVSAVVEDIGRYFRVNPSIIN